LCPSSTLTLMSTRLLSFLTSIEHALSQETGTAPVVKWSSQRSVNFKDGLARVILTPPADAADPSLGGAILLYSFLLSDGSLTLKAVLSWDRSPATVRVSLHAKPTVDWKAEARQIAAAWLAGPPAAATIEAGPSVVQGSANPLKSATG